MPDTVRPAAVAAMTSELNAADPALVGNSALLAAVFSASTDCIKILDLDGRLQFMSEGGKRVMEVEDFGALKACPWPDFWTGAGHDAANAAIAEARDGKPSRFTGQARTAKGTLKMWEVDVLPIIGDDGAATHILSISRDISDLDTAGAEITRLLQETRDSELQCKVALAAAEMGVWECKVIDGKLSDLVADARARELLGEAREGGSNFAGFGERLHPDDAPALRAAARAALDASGDGVLDAEYRVRGQGGAPDRWVQSRAQAVAIEGGVRLIGTVRDISERKDAERRQAVLRDELLHRLKNTFAMVNVIARQTLKGDDITERRDAFSARLHAFARAQDLLAATIDEGTSLRDAVEQALEPHRSDTQSFMVQGPDIALNPKQTVSMALAIHELATNAAKYGALSVDGGAVEITWNRDALGETKTPEFRFKWQERNGPPVAAPTQSGFGSRLIARVLASDFNGLARIDYEPGGVVCLLVSPAASVG